MVELTIGIDLGDVWSHYCTLNQDGEVVDRGRFRTTRKAIQKWFTDIPHARVAMEAVTWLSVVASVLVERGSPGRGEEGTRIACCPWRRADVPAQHRKRKASSTCAAAASSRTHRRSRDFLQPTAACGGVAPCGFGGGSSGDCQTSGSVRLSAFPLPSTLSALNHREHSNPHRSEITLKRSSPNGLDSQLKLT
jgi:hypothetical protein